ncbi:MAG: HU family DNA-binding protein [Clostridia bacterium]|nr:HU family DNA-binding protein [Clostridia bacterium]
MNKSELITAVAEKAEITKKDAEKAVSAMLDIIIEQVAQGEEIRIVGFGTFERHERKERTGCNPRTNEKITIAASKVPAFKAGKAFKDAVDQK